MHPYTQARFPQVLFSDTLFNELKQNQTALCYCRLALLFPPLFWHCWYKVACKVPELDKRLLSMLTQHLPIALEEQDLIYC